MDSASTAALGIDLGTSNSAVALATGTTPARILALAQSAGPGAVEALPLLPSALYLPHADEHAPGSFTLPWTGGQNAPVVGRFARSRGALAPDRLVTSAKSWLCNPRVDRTAAILPWQSESVATTDKISPLDASTRFLTHLRAATGHPDALDWKTTRVVITVPASFDEAARNLTREAATRAGFTEPLLLEEPLAAFYAWLEHAGADWRRHVHPGDIVLVCDVGGGTADFSLIAVGEDAGTLALDRISVGEHILLGGDNLDLALAHALRAQLEDGGQTIDEWQFLALIQAAREAKEALFNDPTLAEVPVAVPTRSARLFAKTVSTRLERSILETIALDGFLPLTDPAERPAARTAGGLREFGLNYAADPALSRHLARFLHRSHQNVASSADLQTRVASALAASRHDLLRPTHVLFNGGVFKAAPMRRRVLDLLTNWFGSAPEELAGADYDLAVARGAAAYGRLLNSGSGVRIRAGTARSYYVGLESTALAVPGLKPAIKALCVAPQGMEEGTTATLVEREFGLVVGEPVEFRLFSSTARAGDQTGALVSDAVRDLEETARVETILPPGDGLTDGDIIPVRLVSRVNELGVLELHLRHPETARAWKLEFKVRTA
jgi:hypothetical protein